MKKTRPMRWRRAPIIHYFQVILIKEIRFSISSRKKGLILSTTTRKLTSIRFLNVIIFKDKFIIFVDIEKFYFFARIPRNTMYSV